MLKKYILLIILLIIPFTVYAIEDERDIVINDDKSITTVEESTDPDEVLEDLTPVEDDNGTDTSDEYISDNTKYRVVIEDNADLLSDNEEEDLLEVMKPLTEYGHIAFVSINSNSSSTEYFARNYYHQTFGTNTGTLFLIDMDNREIYLFSDGANYRVITSPKAYSITDNTFMYAKNSDYYLCAVKTFEQVNTLLNGGKILEPMRMITTVLISIILGFFSCFIFIINKSKIPSADSKKILKYANYNFNIGDIEATKTGVSKIYNPHTDSGGGGSSGGGGGGGGGGSSGGGGGHSF